jgi:hypothetical protein
VSLLAVLLTVTTVGCSSGSRATPSGSGTSHPAGSRVIAGSSDGASTTISGAGGHTVAQLVLQRGDAPAGTTYQKTGSGPQTLDALVRGDKDATKEKALLQQAGFRTSYLSIFTALQLPDTVKQGQIAQSYAAIFPTPAAARAAATRMADSVSGTGTNVVRIPTSGLPADAVALQADLTTISGHSYLYVWTTHNAVSVLINAGGSAFVDAIHALALAVSIARSAPVRSKYRAVDAAVLVLHRGAAPNGTAFAPSRSGAKKPTDIAATQAQASALTRLGLRAVYANAFLSPGFLKPPTTPTAAGSKGNFIASQAQRYRSAAAAHRAYQLFRDREARLFGN